MAENPWVACQLDTVWPSMPGLRSEGVKVFLQTSSRVKSLAQEEESADTRAQAVRVLSGLSKKFHSFALVELASRARSDPFGGRRLDRKCSELRSPRADGPRDL